MRTHRALNKTRIIHFEPHFTRYAEGSVLACFGETKVLCNASIEENVPSHVKALNNNSGWITAEYNMLPRSTHTRSSRERQKVGGRTMEIQRLIGRSLRAVLDLSLLGPRTITLDCDVLQADGGTRTASISGSFVALKLALSKLLQEGKIEQDPLSGYIAAVSVGKILNQYLLDLDYEEDSSAEVDMNLVMTDSLRFVEIQGTGEESTFSEEDLKEFLTLGKKGILEIIEKQKEVLQKCGV